MDKIHFDSYTLVAGLRRAQAPDRPEFQKEPIPDVVENEIRNILSSAEESNLVSGPTNAVRRKAERIAHALAVVMDEQKAHEALRGRLLQGPRVLMF